MMPRIQAGHRENMVTVLDKRPRHPEKANRPDTPVLRKPRLDPGEGAGVLAAVRRDARDRARARPRHRVRGGGLPQHRRVLGRAPRHHDDHGRHLHARLRLLQRQDRTARRARCGGARRTWRTRWRSSGSITSSSRRSTATTSPTAAGAHFAATIRAIRALTPKTTIEVLTPDFLRKDGALEMVVEAAPDVFNHNLETVPSLYLKIRPGARYFHSLRLLQRVKELDPRCSPSPASWSASARRATRCCR